MRHMHKALLHGGECRHAVKHPALASGMTAWKEAASDTFDRCRGDILHKDMAKETASEKAAGKHSKQHGSPLKMEDTSARKG